MGLIQNCCMKKNLSRLEDWAKLTSRTTWSLLQAYSVYWASKMHKYHQSSTTIILASFNILCTLIEILSLTGSLSVYQSISHTPVLKVAAAEAVKRRRAIQKKGGVTGGGSEKTGLRLANKKDVFVARCRYCRRCVRIISEPEKNGMDLSNKKDENLSVVNKHGFESGIAALDAGVFAWETTLYT
ncbi:hypothetical protein C5167_024025 [Papaver somniferum]|uniref:Uncharacterized protein n=1 Tax=Papaver somniferum TaxID=3469 RepID=A0A4Y7JR44_PAPSO|nr:hypothetical protein C5167_024025 [Papaver somniferum]